MRYRIRAVTSEWTGRAWRPVLAHDFFGDTPEQAQHVMDAHYHSDSFFRACVTSGRFGHGVICTTSSTLEEGTFP